MAQQPTSIARGAPSKAKQNKASAASKIKHGNLHGYVEAHQSFSAVELRNHQHTIEQDRIRKMNNAKCNIHSQQSSSRAPQANLPLFSPLSIIHKQDVAN